MDDRLLEKFFKGQCNEEEKQQILHWYLSGQAEKAISDKIEAVWKEEQARNIQWEKASVLKYLNEKIEAAERTHTRDRQPRLHLWKWGYAAAVLFLIIGGWWYIQQQGNRMSETTMVGEQMVYHQTKKGVKRTITLEDHTLVKLNADSRIWYRQPFGEGGKREVFLEGEAFFEVTRDTLRPFQVHVGNIETTVLGTSFNINAYDPKQSVTVSVVTGKVQVQQTQSVRGPVLLVPDEQAVYTPEDSSIHKASFNHQQVLSWKEGTLYFENASFDEIVATLERWYGVEIEVKRHNIEDGFSGAYTNRSLESVLNGIGFVLHFDYEIQGTHVTIK